MSGQNFRSQLGENAWGILRLSVALVCRDSLERSGNSEKWNNLASTLNWLGNRVQSLRPTGDIALCVLSDFSDEETCQATVNRAKTLVTEFSEPLLCHLTKDAAAIVDKAYPDQAFAYRATLIIVSMIAADAQENPPNYH